MSTPDAPGSLAPPLATLAAAYHARKPPRTWSLIVTIFGDHALPRGEAIRLADLQDWLARIGIEPGLVRTALSRLVSNATLTRERDGRAALYRLSKSAERDFAWAAALIYGRNLPRPTGMLELGIIDEQADREVLRQALAQRRFMPLARNLMIRPEHAGDALPAMAGLITLASPGSHDLTVRSSTIWPLASLAQGYRAFAELARAASTAPPVEASQAFLTRILLVHEFRRLVLRDPFLPPSMLSPDWPGAEARLAFERALNRLDIGR